MYISDEIGAEYGRTHNSIYANDNMSNDICREVDYIMTFMVHTDLTTLKGKNQLRALWTAFCIHKNLEVDTDLYDECYIYIFSLMTVMEQHVFSPKSKQASLTFYNWLAKDLV